MLPSSSVLLLSALCLASCATPASEKLASPGTSTKVAVVDDLQPNPMLVPKVYTDGVGVVVELLPLKVPDGETAQALLRVTGLKSYVAGVTFRARREIADSRDSWVVDLDGVGIKIVHRAATHTSEPYLYIPRGNGRIKLQVDEASAKRLDVDDLIADHRAHLADGSLARLAKFDRSYAMEGTRAYNSEGRKEFTEKCGREVELEMDWESFQSPQDFKRSEFCNHALRVLAELCVDRLSYKLEIAEKVDRVQCKLGPDLDIRHEQSTKTLKVHTPAGRFSKGPKGQKIVSKALGLRRVLLKSPKGLYVALPSMHDEAGRVFAGKGPKLYRQIANYKSGGYSTRVWGGAQEIRLSMKGPGMWKADCASGDIPFEETGLAERDRILASAIFEEPIWRRSEKVLARDTKGTYYYVDQIRKEFGGLGYRVFKGPRGRLKLTTMVDIIDDPKGQIFATTSGSLRLILGTGGAPAARWLVGKRSEELQNIDIRISGKLIYQGLGIYAGEELGTICSLAAAGDSGP